MAVYAKVGGVMDVGELLKGKFTPKHDDDLVDRLNYHYTTIMLGLFATLVALKQYVGEPLQCWIPAQFKSPWESYSEKYCFVENTYFVGLDEEVFPKSPEEREARELIYYQWVPILLCIQLILFFIPKAIWSSLNWRTGLTVSTLIDAAKTTEKNKDKKSLKKRADVVENSENITNFIIGVLKFNRTKYLVTNRYFCGVYRWLNGGQVTYLYMFFKLLNCLNTFFQLYLLNKFLGPQYRMWGWGIALDLWNGKNWQQSGHFPRVTYCDVQIREIGQNIHRHTFQCVLMINMFNEKVYIFIWFWLFFLLILNVFNFLYWLVLAFHPRSHIDFIYTHLRYRSIVVDKKQVKTFYDTMLYSDAVTTLRLLANNDGHMAASAIVSTMYNKYVIEKDGSRKAKEEEAKSLRSPFVIPNRHPPSLKSLNGSIATNSTNSTNVE